MKTRQDQFSTLFNLLIRQPEGKIKSTDVPQIVRAVAEIKEISQLTVDEMVELVREYNQSDEIVWDDESFSKELVQWAVILNRIASSSHAQQKNQREPLAKLGKLIFQASLRIFSPKEVKEVLVSTPVGTILNYKNASPYAKGFIFKCFARV